MRAMLRFFPVFALIFSSFASSEESFSLLYQEEARPSKTKILFQGFTWDARVDGQEGDWYNHLASKAKDLFAMGVTHVWFPPVSRSVSQQGYMPGDYYDLGSSQNPTFYGDEQELRAAVQSFKHLGIQPVADIVINHRTASHQEDGQWNVFHHASGKMLWEKWALCKNDYNGTGAPDTGGDFAPAPDIDHTNKTVQKDISQWLSWLISDVGFSGLRFDYSKGYGGEYAGLYANRANSNFCVGEYWSSMSYQDRVILAPNQDPHRQVIVDWMDATEGKCSAFDFTTKGILQEALKNGDFWRLKDKDSRQSGVMGWWPDHAVTFIDNHDTGSSQAHWPFPADHVLAGYAYILTHPGIPTIFWDHLYWWGDYTGSRIRELAKLRKDTGIHEKSELQILKAEHNLYLAEIDRKILIALGSNSYQPASEWKLSLEGPGYKIWIR